MSEDKAGTVQTHELKNETPDAGISERGSELQGSDWVVQINLSDKDFRHNFDVQLGMGEDLEDIVVIYKKGDDLRQDRLTLQLLKVP